MDGHVVLVFFTLSILRHTASAIVGTQTIDDPLLTALMENLPSSAQIKPKKLFRLLGNNFDPEWMSIEDPGQKVGHLQTGTDHFGMSSERVTDILKYLYHFNIDKNNGTANSIASFLRDLSTCTVKYTWEDLGHLVWPRFVKEGYCEESKPCSWPPGMTCKRGSVVTLKILRWICTRHKGTIDRRAKSNANRTGDRKGPDVTSVKLSNSLKCKWRKIPHEVTTSCECQC